MSCIPTTMPRRPFERLSPRQARNRRRESFELGEMLDMLDGPDAFQHDIEAAGIDLGDFMHATGVISPPSAGRRRTPSTFDMSDLIDAVTPGTRPTRRRSAPRLGSKKKKRRSRSVRGRRLRFPSPLNHVKHPSLKANRMR